MDFLMAQACVFSRKEMFTMVIGMPETSTAKEGWSSLMVVITKEAGIETSVMAKEKESTQMAMPTAVALSTVKGRDKA